MSLFAGFDLGTSGGRCVIVDERGAHVASAARPWGYTSENLGMSELEPAIALTALAEAAKEAVAQVDAGELRGVGVTSQRTGVVLLDEAGEVLYSGPNADGRQVAEGLGMEKEHRDVVYRTAGRLPVMLYLPARLAWFRAYRPEVHERVRSALAFSDWLVRVLSGVAATEPTQAAEMLVYDVAAREWSAELCEALGVPPAILPPILTPGVAAGPVTAEAAERFGLPAGVPVVPAGADTQAAAVALGVSSPGEAIVVAGTTMLASQVSAEPAIDPEMRLWTSPHPAGGYVLEAHCGGSGAALSWFADVMGATLGELDGLAAAGQPGSGGVAFVDPVASRVGDFPLLRTGALTFAAPLLALARPRQDVARAVIEGVAFAARAGLEWTAEVGGEPSSVAVAGGVARSETFVRILATALGHPVRAAASQDASGRGAAILAAVGAGAHDTVAEAVEAMADPGRTVDPESSWGDTKSAYRSWREAVDRLDATSLRVSGMTG